MDEVAKLSAAQKFVGSSERHLAAETEGQSLSPELVELPTRTRKALAFGREALTSLFSRIHDTDELPLDVSVENAAIAYCLAIGSLAALGMAAAFYAGTSSPSESHNAPTELQATYYRAAPTRGVQITGGDDPGAMNIFGGSGATVESVYLIMSGRRRRRYQDASDTASRLLRIAWESEREL